ncbi:alginate lyase family protein [Fulvivirga ulvae]|uniref:LamG-like jellyroll fold domain-containing protein n=1 Tax=Fulvivirga ulvae TaxID=2904245 RepID=UPI001F437B40|nr:LamG-like jellyroll fold domain-containing protein [Fulvivirga ulvae]UII30112.1 alginate lyase family protein [Fulvivirga ulvae]
MKVALRLAGLLVLIFAGAISFQSMAQPFVHPGILHTQSDFERMRENVNAGKEPWKSGFEVLVASPYAKLSWSPRPAETVSRHGTGDNVAVLYKDIAAAYQHALMWKITGNTAHGDKAVEILNAWSVTHKTLTGNTDRYLASGLFGYQFANVAELMRDYPGFELPRFQNYMLNVFYYPLVERFLLGNEHGADHNDACITNYWANWDLCNMAAMLAIGILCDNREIYNKGINYFKYGGGNGAIKHVVPHLFSDQLGQWQESGRDQGHTLLGVGLMASFCEIAWNQGDDMYGYDNNRFRKGAEYAAKYNYGEEVPFAKYVWYSWINCRYNEHTVVSNAGRGEYRGIWEMIYNHYGRRLGQADKIPYITAMVEKQRPESGPGGHPTTFDQPGLGTLTRSLGTDCSPTSLTPYMQIGGDRVQTAYAAIDSGASVTLSVQPTDGSISWSTGETSHEITISDITSDTTCTVNFKNSCGALSQQSFVINMNYPTGLIAHYTFEQNTDDVSGSELHADSVNGPVFVRGKLNDAISLDGVDDHLLVPEGILSTAADMTIMTWVKLDENHDWSRIFDFGNNTSEYMFLTGNSGTGTLRFVIKNGDEEHQVNTGALPTGKWVHVAVTLFGDQCTLYVDGEVANTNNSVTFNPYDLGSTTNNFIGRSQYPTDPYLDGSLDDFRIYNYALSASMIYELYAASVGLDVTVYPNPARDLLYIRSKGSGISEVRLFNVLGMEIDCPKQVKPDLSTIDMHFLSQGFYFVNVHFDNNLTETVKIVKK